MRNSIYTFINHAKTHARNMLCSIRKSNYLAILNKNRDLKQQYDFT